MKHSFTAFALVLLALALPLSIAATNVALALLTLSILLRLHEDGNIVRRTLSSNPAMRAIIFYAVSGLVVAALGAPTEACWRDALKDWHRVWVLGIVLAAVTLEPSAPVVRGLFFSIAALALMGIGQTLFGGIRDGMMVRAHGYAHAVVYGEMMALALLGTLCWIFRPSTQSQLARRITIILAALISAALILNQTRMALIAVAAGFATICVLETRARRWAIGAAIFAMAAAIAWEYLPTGGRTLSAVLSGFHPNSPHQTRWTLWKIALRMFSDHPLTGVGLGGYKHFFSSYWPTTLEGEISWGSAHNLYLHQLAERGLLGLTALVVLISSLWQGAWRSAREDLAGGLWAAAAVTAFLFMSLTETTFQNEQFATLFLLCWALGTARKLPVK